MKTLQAHTKVLKGSSYEIGVSLGSMTASVPDLKAFHALGFPGFSREDTKDSIRLFSRSCPGLMEELTGFSDALNTSPEQIVYYAMTYLRPGAATSPCFHR